MLKWAPARYFDGEVALPYNVKVRLTGDALRIQRPISPDGLVLPAQLDWPLASLQRQDDGDGGLLRLASTSAPLARLILEDPGFQARLLEAAPRLSPGYHARRLGRLTALSGLATAAMAAAIWFGGAAALRGSAALVPPEWERQIGDGGFQQVRRLFAADGRPLRVCDGPDGQRALDELAGRLMAHADTPHPARVAVLDHPEVNALALPGGRIVLFRGLIDAAGSPEEVAGVLAHEIAHVVHQHGMQGVLRGLGAGVVLDLMMGGVGALGQVGVLAMESAHTRSMEVEADRTGLELLVAAGIDTAGFARFFDRLAEEEAGTGSAFAYFSTHPPSEQRADAARAGIADRDTGDRAASAGPAMAPEAWRALRGICD